MKKLFYGEHRDQFGHLHLPECGDKFPVMIVIHGGYWKDNHTLESYATSEIVNKFMTSGAAIWNLEYRRMNVDGENLTASWPATFLDVAAGIDFLRTIAKEERLDLSRMMVVGHSAGGHLAVWAASRDSISKISELYRNDPLLPARVISIAGILDLRQHRGLSQPHQVERLMGGTPDEFPDRYSAANPAQLSVGSIPITLIHGDLDDEVPATQSTNFACDADRPALDLIELDGVAHFGMLPLEGQELSAWPTLVDRIATDLELLGAHRPIDPELLPVVEAQPVEMGAIRRGNIDVARQLSGQVRAAMADPAPRIESVKHTISHEDGNTDIYVFRPSGSSNQHALIWFHGGGFVMGTGDDVIGKRLASDVGCTVLSVDYRLAPEHPFPAAVTDGVAAVRWMHENLRKFGIGSGKIAIGGASAGAGLAAGVTLACRDSRYSMPVFQLLMYPMLDNLHDTDSGRLSSCPIWNRSTSINAWEMYFDGVPAYQASAYAAPSRMADLSNLPPTYLCVGDVDLFRDENVLFMQKLIADGSPGEFEVFQGVYHAAEQAYPDAEISKTMYAEILRKLRDGLDLRQDSAK